MKIFLLFLLIFLPNSFINDYDIIDYTRTDYITKDTVIINTNDVYRYKFYLCAVGTVKNRVVDTDSTYYLLSNAACESGWGKSSLARVYNNYFGIKGKGIKLKGVEYVNGNKVYVVSNWATFKDFKSCLEKRLSIKSSKFMTCDKVVYNRFLKSIEGVIRKEVKFKKVEEKEIIFTKTFGNQSKMFIFTYKIRTV